MLSWILDMPFTGVNFCCSLPAAGRAGVRDMLQPCCHPAVAEERGRPLRTHLRYGHIWMWVFRAWQKHHIPQFEWLGTALFTICSCSAVSSGVSSVRLSLSHTQIHRRTRTPPLVPRSYQSNIAAATSCYSETETVKQYPVTSDYRDMPNLRKRGSCW